jgi:hypothetical protein
VSAGPPDELYIGYLKKAPPGVARFVRRTALALLAAVALLAVGIAGGQSPLGSGVFEYGQPRPFAGVVRDVPYPRLEVERPGRSLGSAATHSSYSLVGLGKHGATELTRGLAGRRSRLEGSLIYRGSDTMVEVVAARATDDEQLEKPPVLDLGTVTVRGEIVDSKCYLGVMKPGNGKPHRACAALCIRGGIPPLFVVRDGEGGSRQLLLVDASGRSVNERVLDRVAEPLEITGRLLRDGPTWLLAADPAGYQRLDDRGDGIAR